MKNPTSRDVAKLAGVSQSTVSFVLNGRPDIIISPETRQKVFDAARALNYVPNVFARGLKIKQSRLIGLLIPTITNPYYPMLTQHIEEYAATKGYNILLCNTYRKNEKEEFYLKLLSEKGVDGIIYGFTPQISQYLLRINERIPVVIVGEKNEHLSINTIALNSFKAGEIVAQHLVELGHKNIAYVTSPLNGLTLSRQKRLQGIISKLKEHDLDRNLIVKSEIYEQETSNSTYEIEIGYSMTLKLFAESKITAVIGVNDMVAFGALNAVHHLGFKVPEDISVCGFDNIYLSRLLQPKITTVEHFTNHRSKIAVDVIIENITKSDPSVYRVEYDPELIKRESTGPVGGKERCL